MNLEFTATVDEANGPAEPKPEPPTCCVFIAQTSCRPSSWKPLNTKSFAFTCLILAAFSIILCITSLSLSLQHTGFPTHSSSTPGVCTSFLAFIICMYCCYLCYYLQHPDYSSLILPSKQALLCNLWFLVFLSLTNLLTTISGMIIRPLCLWYTFGSVTGFLASSITLFLLFKHRHSVSFALTTKPARGGQLVVDDRHSLNTSEDDHLYLPPHQPKQVRTINAATDPPPAEEKRHIKCTRKCCYRCCYKACCLHCCCPLTLCIMALLLAIQSCFSANAPALQGALYEMKYDAHSYRLQAKCTGARSMQSNFTIVLSHGGGANSVSLQSLQDSLANDYRVCVYTRPGYFQSDAAPVDAMGDTNRTVVEMFDLLEGKLHEYAPFVVVGHSVGGQLAKNAAFFHRDKVKGIVLLDSVPDFRWQMIDSNGTYQDCVNVFNSRMGLVAFARFLTPFGVLRPFLGNQQDFGTYQEDQFWAVNLDSMWNSQYVEMYRQSKHYEESYSMENALLQPGVLGNLALLSIPAGIDENCTQAGYSVGSQDCIEFERKQRGFYTMHMNQKNASSVGKMVICPYPCKHDFAWTKVDWIVEQITPFLQSLAV